jgi:hypothetical protein
MEAILTQRLSQHDVGKSPDSLKKEKKRKKTKLGF